MEDDQKHAHVISDAVDALNRAVRQAHEAGLVVTLATDTAQTFNERYPRPFVRADVVRPIRTED